jgi:hypothetical protein
MDLKGFGNAAVNSLIIVVVATNISHQCPGTSSRSENAVLVDEDHSLNRAGQQKDPSAYV